MSDYNPADWDWTMLQRGLESLRMEASRNREWGNQAPDLDDKRDYHAVAMALEHTADFIEYHIREGDIKSPLQTYFEEK